MELDENLPDTVLQDEDTQNGQNLLGSQIVHNMFTLDMPQPLVIWTVSETIIICSYAHNKSVHTNACNKQSDVCYLSYFHVHTAINILRCFGYPREHNFGLVLILSPTGCTEGCVYSLKVAGIHTSPIF